MVRSWKIAVLSSGIAALAWWFGVRADSGAYSPAPSDRPGSAQPVLSRPGALGSASCAATGCHGNVERLPSAYSNELATTRPDDCWKSSYQQWANYDRHAQAFEALLNERSKNIERNLQSIRKLEKPLDAARDKDCLACHVNPTLAARTDDFSRALHAEGVGCEACHGDAERWRNEHTEWTVATDRRRAYKSVGMTALFDPAVRAETCVGCHVGAPAAGEVPLRDVNHDLIAAGHPRLNFELATYLRKLPPHWKERNREEGGKPRPPGFEAQFWAIGQSAAAEASLQLLRERATSPEAARRWPEFAEFNCYACHHDLQPTNWRRESAGPGFGSLVWNRPADFALTETDKELKSALDEVESKLKERLRDPRNDLKAAIDRAIAPAAKRTENLARTDPHAIARRLCLMENEQRRLDWDVAARLYTAAVAIANAQLDRRPAAGKERETREIEERLSRLHTMLRLPRKPEHFDSPKKFTPQKVQDQMRDLYKLLESRESR